MKNFSKSFKETKKAKYNIKYDGYLKVKEKDGYEFVVESDCVIMIPHLLEYDEFLFRKKLIPPYTYSLPNKEMFLTTVSGTIDNNEKPIDTLKRELIEECGIKLNSTYNNFVNYGDFFMTKGNSAKYHIFYIPLNRNDYTIVPITGDGSEAEKHSKTIRVDKKILTAIIPSDIITAFCIEKIKNIND